MLTTCVCTSMWYYRIAANLRHKIFCVFRGLNSNLKNFACKKFRTIMHIRRDIYGIRENYFREIQFLGNLVLYGKHNS